MGAIHLGKISEIPVMNVGNSLFLRWSFFPTYLTVEEYFPRNPHAGVSKKTAKHLKRSRKHCIDTILQDQPSCLAQLTSRGTEAECVTEMECQIVQEISRKLREVDQNFRNKSSGKGCSIWLILSCTFPNYLPNGSRPIYSDGALVLVAHALSKYIEQSFPENCSLTPARGEDFSEIIEFYWCSRITFSENFLVLAGTWTARQN